VKLVREHIILEKFIEDSDPISDMGIGMIEKTNRFLEDNEINFKFDDIKILDPRDKRGLIESLLSMQEYDILEFLLEQSLIDFNDVALFADNYGIPLRNAAYKQDWKTCKFLVDHGIDLEKTITSAKKHESFWTLKRLLEFKEMLEKNQI